MPKSSIQMSFVQCWISNFWSPIKTLQKQSPYQSNAKTPRFCYGKIYSRSYSKVAAHFTTFGPIFALKQFLKFSLSYLLLHQNLQKFSKKFSKFKMVQSIYLSMQKKFKPIQVLLIPHQNLFSKVLHQIIS